MIRIQCPVCSSFLNAKSSLAGKVRKCPNCKHPIQIPADGAQPPSAVEDNASRPEAAAPHFDDDAAGADFIISVKDRLPPGAKLPDRLDRDNLYLICGKGHLAAKWEHDSRGWMIRGAAGFVSARRNRDLLPPDGQFTLVELQFEKRPEGKRLVGIMAYELVHRWALTVLDEGDDAICTKITGFSPLNRDQKHLVRQMLKEHYMREVWEHSAEVLEFLSNNDFHSPGAGAAKVEHAGQGDPPLVGAADFLGATVYVDNRIPRGFDFAFSVFKKYNPRAAEVVAERQRVEKLPIESQYLGATGLAGEDFVRHALELAREEPPCKGIDRFTLIVQENRVTFESVTYHTVLCSYFRTKEAREIVLKPGESLDGLLR